MAGMRAVHKKDGTTFKFSGELKEAIEKAEKELKEKEGTTQWLFLKWQYDNAKKALDCLPLLKNCNAHCSVILSSLDTAIFRRLRINLTCEPKYQNKKLFHNN